MYNVSGEEALVACPGYRYYMYMVKGIDKWKTNKYNLNV